MSDPKDAPQPPVSQPDDEKPSPVRTALRWVLVVVLLVIIGVCARKIMRELAPEPEPKPITQPKPAPTTKPAKPKAPAKAQTAPAGTQPAPAPQSSEKRHNIGALSLVSPLKITPDIQTQANLAKAHSQDFESIEAYVSEFNADHELLVSIIVFNLQPGSPFDLDAGAKGAIQKVALLCGDSKPQFTITPLTIDGCQARQAAYAGTKNGRAFTLDGLLVAQGQTVWMMQAVAMNPRGKPVGEAILASIKMDPAPRQ